jgi:non-homologous end joining protein Ku
MMGFPKYQIEYLWREGKLYRCKDYWQDRKTGDIPAWYSGSINEIIGMLDKHFKSCASIMDDYSDVIMQIINNCNNQINAYDEVRDLDDIEMLEESMDDFPEYKELFQSVINDKRRRVQSDEYFDEDSMSDDEW